MDDCICEGNWRNIVKGSEHLLGKEITEESTWDIWTLDGILHTEDDFYYLVRRNLDGKYRKLSCVGDLKSWGFAV